MIDLSKGYKAYIQEKKHLELILHVVWVASFTTISIYNFHFLRERRKFVNLVNQIISLGNYMRGKFNYSAMSNVIG